MNSVIELEINGKTFKKKNLTILEDFSLKIDSGEKVSIVGESGVGKTSLLNILGLLDSQFNGNYKLFNSDVKYFSQVELAKWRNKRIGFVLQDSALINSLTIQDNIKLPLMYSNLEKDSNFEKYYNRIVEKIGIKSILDKKPHECSGGQKSRAVFARGVIMQPDIVLSDEPTASLDLKHKNDIIDLLFEMNKEFNTTIITVTHDLDVANRHDRVIKLERNE
ncbi:ABC transporter ATP-binding protein [Mammaliicoccus sciuri]|uniref:ABC transporter ATP-binding protein n=1 Tax=Mammaliicoccus sciuri TaxID=1296 RepID=UPI001E4D431E|nr:ATP-binding cassette domain-containing protein [Mammaliicoccus sciuri]MCD8794993.1 ATP-binding cassette domain-containing protein [Mammaliicoccus sciuri]MCJ0950836.1 ATP-binding cassette domain-containing protein [Mammaliicoccus sciuri]